MEFHNWEINAPVNSRPYVAGDFIGFDGSIPVEFKDKGLDEVVFYEIDPQPRTFTAETLAPLKLGDRITFQGVNYGVVRFQGRRFWAIEVK